MKIKIFLLACLLMIVSLCSRAQDSANVTWGKVYNDVKGAVTALSSSLKVGTERVYLVMVKQQAINAIIYSTLIGIGLIFALITWRYLKWYFKEDPYDDPGWAVLAITLVIVTLIILGIGIGHIGTIITGLSNPEYGAINDIFDKIHGK